MSVVNTLRSEPKQSWSSDVKDKRKKYAYPQRALIPAVKTS